MTDPKSVRTIPQLVRAAAETYGDAPAIIDGDLELSFAELAERVSTAARGFIALGLMPGDRVGIWAPNSHRWVIAALGVLSAGGTVVPLNTRYRGAEAREFLARTQARCIVVEQGFLGYDHLGSVFDEATEDGTEWSLDALEILVDVGTSGLAAAGGHAVTPWGALLEAAETITPEQGLKVANAVMSEDLSDIIFTSGTTGRAKGVQLTHGAPLQLYVTYGEIWGIKPGDRYLIVLPFFHGGGNKAGMILSIMFGVTIVPMAVFDAAAAMAEIERRGISVMNGSPTIYTSILDHPDRGKYDLSTLRVAATGAAVVPAHLVERARTELPFQNFITAYGLTECCGTATMCRQGDPEEVVNTTNGRALPDVEVVIVDPSGKQLGPDEPGEVWIRGFNVSPGYWQDPVATAEAIDEDGWLHSGDIGELTAEGNLRITDRLKDLFIVGGFNVSPAEVEQVLVRHPAVSEVSVIGVPDERLGEVARAYVIPKHGVTLDPDEMIVWSRERLANFKVPRSIVVVESLPRNASGKVLKRELRKAVAE
ncbi:MAG TPA: AMP-binding protein [Jatrophihabitans sp.]|jgi:acyl-CoA synthetase (AMP-forming)/AMP-acid ligase II